MKNNQREKDMVNFYLNHIFLTDKLTFDLNQIECVYKEA